MAPDFTGDVGWELKLGIHCGAVPPQVAWEVERAGRTSGNALARSKAEADTENDTGWR